MIYGLLNACRLLPVFKRHTESVNGLVIKMQTMHTMCSAAAAVVVVSQCAKPKVAKGQGFWRLW